MSKQTKPTTEKGSMNNTPQSNVSELQRAFNALRLEVDGSIVDSIEEISKEHDRLLIVNERERIAQEMDKQWQLFLNSGANYTKTEPHKSLTDIVYDLPRKKI
jgi:hypothetical protein